MARRQIPAKFSRWSNLWDQWNQKLETAKVSRLVACLSCPLSLEQVDRVIVGVDSAKQLSEILEAANSANDELDTTFMRSSDVDLINPSRWAYL
jgi:hydroxyethylthiazole kinase-like sugar kinase family protein